ncbi:MAG TPA: cation diffusion facilitator family transporter [Acidimicrobiales bacterium]|nr:cation diffusion facilitator family transporter [Acidimicrobiales bacterium]
MAETDAGTPSGGESMRTVVVALLANGGIALAKGAAAVITGSTAMFAETVHSVADTGNEVLLLVAHRRGQRRAEPGRLSRGREAYFWAMLAAIGVFVVGAVIAIFQGIHELIDPVEAESFAVAYVVLVVAFLLEGVSFLQASRQLHGEASELDRTLLQHVRLTSDPTTRAVFAEDAAALIGNVLALVGIALHQITGSVVPDALASIGIGLVLAGVAFFLVERNRDFLVGEEVAPAGKQRIADALATWPGVVEVRDLVVTFTGPDEIWVVARVDVDDTLTGAQVEELASGIERRFVEAEPSITRVDIVPVGQAAPAARPAAPVGDD